MPMPGLEQKLEELREEYSKTRYNKATNKHLGILRRKMADIKKEIAGRKRAKGAGFAVRKSGDATVALVGFPNAGKSSLIRLLTGVDSKVADYAFTTVTVIPGMMRYGGAKVQILDIPGLIEGAHTGVGEGARIASVIRTCDLLLFVCDINHPEHIGKLLDELYGFGIIVNGKKPMIKIDEDAKGIEIDLGNHKAPPKKEVMELLKESKIYNAKVIFYQDSDIEDVAEVLEDRVYIKAIAALNKADTVTTKYSESIRKELKSLAGMPVIVTSAARGTGLEELKKSVFESLGIIRIYLKPRDGSEDRANPLIINGGGNVMDVARKLHSKTAKDLKFAYITGRSAKFANQRVGPEHQLADEDVVTLVYEKALSA